MKRIYVLPAAILGLALSTPAFADDTVSAESQSKTTMEKNADGTYHRKDTRSTESTDSEGTTTNSEVKVKADRDANGNGGKEVTTETSTDPKGLMNKSKTTTTNSVKYKDGKIEKKYKRKVNGKTVEEDAETTKN